MSGEFGLLIRVMAAVVWTMLTVRAYRLHRDVYMRRLLAMGVLTMVLWGLVLRGVTILGLLADAVSQPLITGTIFLAFIVGVSMLTTQPDA